MEKRIPIDELFHDALNEGREQMNLGAWANMERMLDGKNPYAAEEDKKKRRFLPFILMFLATTAIVGAGYLINSGKKGSTTQSTAVTNTTVQPEIPENNSNPEPFQPQQAATSPTSISTPNDAVENNKPSSGNSSVPRTHKSNSGHKDNHIKSADNNIQQTDNTTNDAIVTNEINSNTNRNTQKRHSSITKKNAKAETATSDLATSQKSYKGDHAVPNSNQANSTTDLTSSKDVTTIKTKTVEKIPVTTINQRTIRKRDGSVQKLVGDTVGISVYEKVTETLETERPIASLDPTQTNPRYRPLSIEEEENAGLRKQQQTPSNTQSTVLASSIPAAKISSEISLNNTQKASKGKQTGYFEDLRKFFTDTYTKISNFMVYSPKPDIYTGMTMGFNTSLGAAKNNFGGFQAGFTTLKPINDYFSFISECKFFYRNNGGYTANDISYEIKNTEIDNVSLNHLTQTVYTYQKDSMVKTYNFKNFYSLELPLMMQFNYRSISTYAGVNLAYNFKLKTTEKNKNYVSTHRDTLDASVAHSFPANKGSQYLRSDFSSRFGVGYTVGATYSFSPQLYLDLRITQNVWDNMKSLAAREISNGFFKVPSVQFSLGYRFRKYTPDN